MQAKKRSTIIVTESGVATVVSWWDQLAVSKSKVQLTAAPGVAPPVVLTLVRAASAEEAGRWFKAINTAVGYSARCFDVRTPPLSFLEDSEEES